MVGENTLFLFPRSPRRRQVCRRWVSDLSSGSFHPRAAGTLTDAFPSSFVLLSAPDESARGTARTHARGAISAHAADSNWQRREAGQIGAAPPCNLPEIGPGEQCYQRRRLLARCAALRAVGGVAAAKSNQRWISNVCVIQLARAHAPFERRPWRGSNLMIAAATAGEPGGARSSSAG